VLGQEHGLPVGADTCQEAAARHSLAAPVPLTEPLTVPQRRPMFRLKSSRSCVDPTRLCNDGLTVERRDAAS